jgi:ATP-dependent helicase HrpB
VCYRLWSQDQHEQLAAYGSAEICRRIWRVWPATRPLGRHAGQLVWLDVPPAAAYAQAQDLLQRLGALEGETLTAHGQAMAELPAHPRIAHLLLRGQAWGWQHMACDVAALLGERDILRGAGADLHSRLVLLSGEERRTRCSGRRAAGAATGAAISRLSARQGQRSRSAIPIIRAGSARCWRWPIPIASPNSDAPVAPNIAWPMAALRCSPKPTA